MSTDESQPERASLTGAIAANLHEGSRSEYLAQFVFSSFGTAVPVPHQEDTGIDIYCTLLEREGQRAWPRAYFSVQVKSGLDPWKFESPESVRWLIQHPLPIFLCIVQKSQARLLIYHTEPRFVAWALAQLPERLELIPGTATQGHNVIGWAEGNKFQLDAPILNFTIQEILDSDFRARAIEVLKFWIDLDVEHIFRMKCGIHRFTVPYDYKTNTTDIHVWEDLGVGFREESWPLAKQHIEGLLALLAARHVRNGEWVSAAIYAMALRQLTPERSRPDDLMLHAELNRLLGMKPPVHIYAGCDALLAYVKAYLARLGIVEDDGVT